MSLINNPQQYFKKAQILHRSGNLNDALSAYKKLSEKFPHESLYLNLIAQIYLQLNLINDGIFFLKKSLLINSTQASVYLDLGTAYQKIGEFEESLNCYLESIKYCDNNPKIFFNTGIVLLNLNRLEDALIYFKNVLKFKPQSFESYFAMGLIFGELNQNDEALIHYDKAIQINPNYAEAYNNKGVILNKLNQNDEALIHYDKAIQINPNYAEAYNNKGVILNKLNQNDEALIHYDKAIQINPNYAEAYNNKGVILNKLNQNDEALIHYDKAIQINPNYAEAYNNKGVILNKLNQNDEALIHYDKAIQINPNYAEAYNNKGVILNKLNQNDEALIHYDKAIQINPNYAEAYNNKGVILFECHQYQEALKQYDKAIELNQDYSSAYQNKAIFYLSFCDFKNGWKFWEFRDNLELNKKQDIYKNFQDLNRVFIFKEQGLGDNILYASIFYEIDKKQSEIYIEVDQRLLKIFNRSFNYLKFLPTGTIPPRNNFDSQIALASLPAFFRKNKDDFKKQKKSFLFSDTKKTREFSNKLRSKHPNKKICGISWRSSNLSFGKDKSISLWNLEPILRNPDIIFVNLQYDSTAEEIKNFFEKTKIKIEIFTEIDLYNDIDALFSIVDACDFIITISNITAHVAGSLGKKTFLLAPFGKGRLYYWHPDLNQSIWYPSIQVFDQTSTGEFTKAINEINKIILKS